MGPAVRRVMSWQAGGVSITEGQLRNALAVAVVVQWDDKAVGGFCGAFRSGTGRLGFPGFAACWALLSGGEMDL